MSQITPTPAARIAAAACGQRAVNARGRQSWNVRHQRVVEQMMGLPGHGSIDV